MTKDLPSNRIRPILDLLKKAASVQTGPDIYCNHAQIHLSINDMIIDFYLLAPEVGDYAQIKATHIQRVIIPLNMAKGLAGAISDTVAKFEQETGITLLDTRVQIPSETVRE
ncbi:MAG: DUF3467 domain-containing protein [Anaerolineales bacterium]